MMNLAQVEPEEWRGESPTGECNVIWQKNISCGHAGVQDRRESNAIREAEYYKTPAVVQAQREQHWMESDDEEPIQIQEGIRADKDQKLAYARVKAGAGPSAVVRMLRLLTLARVAGCGHPDLLGGTREGSGADRQWCKSLISTGRLELARRGRAGPCARALELARRGRAGPCARAR